MTLGDAHAIDVAIRRLPVVGPADAMALDLAVLVRTSGGVVALLRFERDGLGVGGVAYGLPVAGSGNVRRYHYCPVDVSPLGPPMLFDTTDYVVPDDAPEELALERFLELPHWTIAGVVGHPVAIVGEGPTWTLWSLPAPWTPSASPPDREPSS